MSALFGFERRLHQPAEFSAVLSAGKVIRGEQFELLFHLTETDTASRLGLIIPKRLAKAASLRNAIKRQGRETFRRASLHSLPCDLVLRLYRPLKGIKADDKAQRLSWRTDIESLFGRLLVRMQ